VVVKFYVRNIVVWKMYIKFDNETVKIENIWRYCVIIFI